MSTVLEALTPCVLPPTVSESCAARTASTDGERVYVGTTDGFVCGWRATQPWTLRVRVSSAGRAVEKIVVLRDYGAIAVLCDHAVQFYTYPDMSSVHRAYPAIRGVVQVAVDERDPSRASLCVIKRQNLWVVGLDDAGWFVRQDMPIPRDAFIAHRYGDVVCLATRTAYALVHLPTGACTPVGLPISQSTQEGSARTRPAIVPVPGDMPCFLITSHSEHGTLGVFLRADGEPTARLVEWPSHPRAVVASPLHLVALLRNDTIHLHDLVSLQRVAILRADVDDRYLVRVAPPSPALLPRRPVPSAQVLPSRVYPAELPRGWLGWSPVSVLVGGRRGLRALASPMSSSAALLDTGRADDEAAMQYLGVSHLREGRFACAAAYLRRFPPALLLTLWPALYGGHRTYLCEAAAGVWARLPATIDEVISQHLAWNYVPAVDEHDASLVYLHAQLRRRADDMLAWVLASQDAGSTARVQIALARDPHAPLTALPALASCDVPTIRGVAESLGRHDLVLALYRAHQRYADAAQYACLHDDVPGVLEQAASLAPADLWVCWLWLVRRDVMPSVSLPWDDLPHRDEAWQALCAIETPAALATMERVVLTASSHVDVSMQLDVLARVRDDVHKACLWLEYGPPALLAQTTRHPLEDAIVHAKHDRFVDALACLVRARAFEAADDLCMHGSPWPVPRALDRARAVYPPRADEGGADMDACSASAAFVRAPGHVRRRAPRCAGSGAPRSACRVLRPRPRPSARAAYVAGPSRCAVPRRGPACVVACALPRCRDQVDRAQGASRRRRYPVAPRPSPGGPCGAAAAVVVFIASTTLHVADAAAPPNATECDADA